MKKLVIIGASEFQLPLINKAKQMGYETHVFAWLKDAVGKNVADFFYPVSITEKEEILKECKKISPDGIASIGSDLAVLTVNYIARALRLPANPEVNDIISTNKFEMRKVFLENSISVPKFLDTGGEVTVNQLASFSYPLIVKPTDRSGSRGVTKVKSFEEVNDAVKHATSYSFEGKAIIEEFIEGNEYSCECISFNGKHSCLAFTRKYTTGSPCFIETGHIEPADIPSDKVDNYIQAIFKALDALQIKNGASHCEFKITNNGEMKIIEIGSRMGGDCIGSDLVYLSTGYDFLKMVIDVACGNAPELIKNKKEEYAGIRFIFNQHDINILDDIKREHPEIIKYVSEFASMDHDVVDSSTRFGFYIMADENPVIIKHYLES